jgi:hypothetical protein
MAMCTIRFTIPELKIRQLLALSQKFAGGSNNTIRDDLSLLSLHFGKQLNCDRHITDKPTAIARSNIIRKFYTPSLTSVSPNGEATPTA